MGIFFAPAEGFILRLGLYFPLLKKNKKRTSSLIVMSMILFFFFLHFLKLNMYIKYFEKLGRPNKTSKNIQFLFCYQKLLYRSKVFIQHCFRFHRGQSHTASSAAAGPHSPFLLLWMEKLCGPASGYLFFCILGLPHATKIQLPSNQNSISIVESRLYNGLEIVKEKKKTI